MLRQHHVALNACFDAKTLKATPEPHRAAGLSLRLMPRLSMAVLLCGVCRTPVPRLVVDLSFLQGEKLILE